MPTEQELVASIAAKKAAYHEAAPTESAAALAVRSAEIRIEMDALCVMLRGEAGPCPDCGAEPIGMLKTPAYVKKGREVPAVYAVRCANPKHPVRMSKAGSPRAAALLWNAGEFEVVKG